MRLIPHYFAATVLVVSLLAACATDSTLPTRQVEHPYTLPEYTTHFALGAGVASVRDDVLGDAVYLGYPVGQWEVPISNSWTWEVLMAFRHQFHRDEKNTYGMRFGIAELGYSSSSGWFIQPLLNFFYQRRVGANLALNHTLGGNYSSRSEHSSLNGWKAFYELGALFQLDDSKSLTPRLTLGLERRYSNPQLLRSTVLPENKAAVTLPLGIDFNWRLGQQWATELSYDFYGIGYSRGFRSHQLALAFSRYY